MEVTLKFSPDENHAAMCAMVATDMHAALTDVRSLLRNILKYRHHPVSKKELSEGEYEVVKYIQSQLNEGSAHIFMNGVES